MSDSDYQTGWGKPPKHSQFKPGRSGNPRGRPRGSQNIASRVRRILRERIVVQENGRRKSMTKAEAIARQAVLKAMQGDLRAVEKVVVLYQSAEEAELAAAEKLLREINFESFTLPQLEMFLQLAVPPDIKKAAGVKELDVDKKTLKVLKDSLGF